MKSTQPNQAEATLPLPTQHAGTAAQTGDKDAAIILDSASLLQGQQGVLIRHGNEIYRLSRTRQGKLILTK